MPSITTTSYTSSSFTVAERRQKSRRIFLAATSEPLQDAHLHPTSPGGMDTPPTANFSLARPATPPQRPFSAAGDHRNLTEQTSTPKSSKHGSQDEYSCDRPHKHDSEDNVRDWDEDFRRHFYLAADLSIADYLRCYVPCADDTGAPPKKNLLNVFKLLEHTAKDEKDMYDPLVKGLTSLVDDFPEHLRPVFDDTSTAVFEPPHFSQHRTSPDICSSYPGAKAIEKGSYSSAATIWEVKRLESADPIAPSGIIKKKEAASLVGVQIAKYARNLLLGSRSCFIFIIGVYGRNMRIFRFDHAGVIASVAVDYVESPEAIREFLWRLVHPAHKLPGTVVGWDPTMRKPTNEELETMYTRLVRILGPRAPPSKTFERDAMWMMACIKLENNNDEGATKIIIPDGHRFTRSPLKIDRFQGIEVRCLAFKLLYESLTLFGRATTVYEVLIDHPQFADKTYVLKDAWQQRTRVDEGYNYARIRNHLADARIRQQIEETLGPHLPQFLGFAEREDWNSLHIGLAPWLGTYNFELFNPDPEEYGLVTKAARLKWEHDQAMANDEDSLQDSEEDESELGRSAANDSRDGDNDLSDNKEGQLPGHGLLDFQYDANEGDMRDGDDEPPSSNGGESENGDNESFEGDEESAEVVDEIPADTFDRSRVRTLIALVGRRLTEFHSTKELAATLRDVVVGLIVAYFCGLVHRDVSSGNILILDDHNCLGGFLHDLDYSTPCATILDGNPDEFMPYVDKQLKDVTGTLPFMSVLILPISGNTDFNPPPHELGHDLESVFWVLYWCLLRHVDVSSGNINALDKFVDAFRGRPKEYRTKKMGHFFQGPSSRYTRNQPLDGLVKDLLKLFGDYTAQKLRNPGLLLDPVRVLLPFNQALAASGWPSHDASIPYPPKNTEKEKKKGRQGSKLKHGHATQQLRRPLGQEKQKLASYSESSRQRIGHRDSSPTRAKGPKHEVRAPIGEVQGRPKPIKTTDIGQTLASISKGGYDLRPRKR